MNMEDNEKYSGVHVYMEIIKEPREEKKTGAMDSGHTGKIEKDKEGQKRDNKSACQR